MLLATNSNFGREQGEKIDHSSRGNDDKSQFVLRRTSLESMMIDGFGVLDTTRAPKTHGRSRVRVYTVTVVFLCDQQVTDKRSPPSRNGSADGYRRMAR